LNFLKKNFGLIAVILCCIPVFFLNMKDSHDWGDDFAQYLLQARNILEHRPQTDNGLVFDSSTPDYALRAYPVGFPLMLAAVETVAGNKIISFSYFISGMLLCLCILSFIYYRKYHSALTAFFLVLIFLYNPFTISFKAEILSDIPFSFLLLLLTFIYLHMKRNYLTALGAGVLAGLLISTRGIGIAFIIAMVLFAARECYLLYRQKQKQPAFRVGTYTLIVLVTGYSIYHLLNEILFPIGTKNFVGFYSEVFSLHHLYDSVLRNLEYNIEVFKAFFEPNAKDWQFASKISKSLAFTFTFIGIINSCLKRLRFEDILVITYVCVILVYPYSNGGFRFIIPLVPFLFYYTVEGIKCVQFHFSVNRKWLATVCGVTVLLLYIPSLADIVKYRKQDFCGPQLSGSREMISIIKENVPDSGVIVFKKPRIIPLYANKKAAYISNDMTAPWMYESFKRMNAHYFLVSTQCSDIIDSRLEDFIEKYKSEMKVIWQNNHFILYSNLGF
jgi:hypothetical protein